MSATSSTSSSFPTNSSLNGSTNNPTSSSGLYLYTFLATLLLLLAISAMIVGRSILVRRRTRHIVEQAIANGTWITPSPKIPINLRDKPYLHHAYTVIAPQHEDSSLKKAALWDSIKPVSVSLAKSDVVRAVHQLSVQESLPNPPPRRAPMARLFRSRTSVPPPSNIPEPQVSSSLPPQEYETITVSVMIAMPSLLEFKSHQHDKTEQECPAVQFGLSEIKLPPGWSLEPRALSTV